ncbi:unnamed protein product [Protopolystoma xenopodis]|uniref:Uncharacterized protein n=1 Tax=Protopolystoma xenopodis TaxID=117903 RepID=A0A448WPC2_9PLAT|nr:unnamed protein product [Protopolystoma xenopodis]
MQELRKNNCLIGLISILLDDNRETTSAYRESVETLRLHEEITAVLWNLSASTDARPELAEAAVPVLTSQFLLPAVSGLKGAVNSGSDGNRSTPARLRSWLSEPCVLNSLGVIR